MLNALNYSLFATKCSATTMVEVNTLLNRKFLPTLSKARKLSFFHLIQKEPCQKMLQHCLCYFQTTRTNDEGAHLIGVHCFRFQNLGTEMTNHKFATDST